jgi:hypothetical protein
LSAYTGSTSVVILSPRLLGLDFCVMRPHMRWM